MNKRQRESQYFRIHELYCLKQVERGRYIKLNRDYKPLGMETQETVRYEAFPLVSLPGLTPEVATQLSSRGSDDLSAICLYDDGCVPTRSAANMLAYQRKLALLSKLKVSGWRSRLARPSCGREDRVHLDSWWTREHFGRRQQHAAASAQAQRGVQSRGCCGLP